MFPSRKTRIGMLAAGCLALGLPATTFARAEKASADVIVQAVKVHTTTKNDEPWDLGGGAPDLKVLVRKKGTGGQSHTTKVKPDTFEAEFGERTIRISAGDTVEVIVYDADAKLDDVVGKKTVKITQAMLDQREVKLTRDFGRVITLVLEFEP